MCKVEIIGPDQFTDDEILTIKELIEDRGLEYGLNSDPDKVDALEIKIRRLVEKMS